MSDIFSSEEDIGFGSRLKSSLGGAVIGLALFFAAFPVHFWNEGRAVAQQRALEEGEASVVEAKASPLDPALEGKLAHVSGKATAQQPVRDEQFGIDASALALERQVEMFQWREKKETHTEKKLGGGEHKVTKYTYDTAWDEDLVDSRRFEHPDGHANPERLPFESRRFDADPVRLGDLVLSAKLAARIRGSEPLAPNLAALPANLGASFTLDDGRLVTGRNPAKPEVGDLRVAWTRVPEQVVSVVGLLHNGAVEPYSTSNGREIALLESGDVPATQMFQAAQSRNSHLTWALRAAGTAMMWLGLVMSLGLFARLADVVPFIGTLVERGIAIVAALIAIVFSTLTIAVAWFYYRPWIAAVLVAVAAAAVLLLRRRGAKPPPPPRTTAMPPPPPPRG